MKDSKALNFMKQTTANPTGASITAQDLQLSPDNGMRLYSAEMLVRYAHTHITQG